SRWAGIGYVFSREDPFTGIDLDQLDDEAREWIARFDSYAEVSPSGTGAHVIIRGTPPSLTGKKAGGYEAYSWGRFFTMTGDQIPGSPNTVEGRQDVLEQFVAEKFPPETPPAPARPPAAPSGPEN